MHEHESTSAATLENKLTELPARSISGLRYSLSYPRDHQTRLLKACSRKIGRREYYPASEVSRIIIGIDES